jgi:hypothetical protein
MPVVVAVKPLDSTFFAVSDPRSAGTAARQVPVAALTKT